MSDIRINIPEKANTIIRTLKEAGYDAYVVGGCVRDSILGREPQDWDITTSALPLQVKALFRRTVDTGLKHGTVTIMIGDEGFEVTTYRIDGVYDDGRHPENVTFTPNLEEDLLRRDFTINAMAYNDTVGLVDLYGGIEDMKKGIIRCVGDANARFSEDALRILRAVRFSAQLGYDIEESTYEAIKQLRGNLKLISAERIQVELSKLLASKHPDRIRMAYDTGITEVIMPEFDRMMKTEQNHPHHCYSVGEHTIHAIIAMSDYFDQNPEMNQGNKRRDLCLTMLLHDIGKPDTLVVGKDGITHFGGHPKVSEEMAIAIMRRLKLDNHTIDKVSHLVRCHDYGNGIDPTPHAVRRAMNKIGTDEFEDYLLVKMADTLAQSDYMRKEKLDAIEAWREGYKAAVEANECVSIKMLAVSGRDLIKAGIKPGPVMGEILDSLLEQVIEAPEKNEREYLLSEAMRIANV